jgi:hypothetical protein
MGARRRDNGQVSGATHDSFCDVKKSILRRSLDGGETIQFSSGFWEAAGIDTVPNAESGSFINLTHELKNVHMAP